MPRQTFRYRDGQVVGPDGLPMLNQAERAREPQAPFTISDCQPHLKSMADGHWYDSKSEMRKGYKREGVTEVGTETCRNDKREKAKADKEARKKRREKIKGALYKAHSQLGGGAP